MLSVGEIVSRLKAGTLPDRRGRDHVRRWLCRQAHRSAAAAGRARHVRDVVPGGGAVGQQREFWWDELPRIWAIFVRRRDARHRKTRRGGRGRSPAPIASAPTSTCGSGCVAQPRRNATTAMTKVREGSSSDAPNPADLPMTPHEVGEVGRAGVFEIGGHTSTHPVLPLLDSRQRRRDIARGKQCCEGLARRPIAVRLSARRQRRRFARGRSPSADSAGHARPPARRSSPDSDWFALPRLAVLDCGRGRVRTGARWLA